MTIKVIHESVQHLIIGFLLLTLTLQTETVNDGFRVVKVIRYPEETTRNRFQLESLEDGGFCRSSVCDSRNSYLTQGFGTSTCECQCRSYNIYSTADDICIDGASPGKFSLELSLNLNRIFILKESVLRTPSKIQYCKSYLSCTSNGVSNCRIDANNSYYDDNGWKRLDQQIDFEIIGLSLFQLKSSSSSARTNGKLFQISIICYVDGVGVALRSSLYFAIAGTFTVSYPMVLTTSPVTTMGLTASSTISFVEENTASTIELTTQSEDQMLSSTMSPSSVYIYTDQIISSIPTSDIPSTEVPYTTQFVVYPTINSIYVTPILTSISTPTQTIEQNQSLNIASIPFTMSTLEIVAVNTTSSSIIMMSTTRTDALNTTSPLIRMMSTTRTDALDTTSPSIRMMSTTRTDALNTTSPSIRMMSTTRTDALNTTSPSIRMMSTRRTDALDTISPSIRMMSTTRTDALNTTSPSMRMMSTTRTDALDTTSPSIRMMSTTRTGALDTTSPSIRMMSTRRTDALNTTSPSIRMMSTTRTVVDVDTSFAPSKKDKQNSDAEKKDKNMLLIIITSVLGAFLLFSCILALCFYHRWRNAKKQRTNDHSMVEPSSLYKSETPVFLIGREGPCFPKSRLNSQSTDGRATASDTNLYNMEKREKKKTKSIKQMYASIDKFLKVKPTKNKSNGSLDEGYTTDDNYDYRRFAAFPKDLYDDPGSIISSLDEPEYRIPEDFITSQMSVSKNNIDGDYLMPIDSVPRKPPRTFSNFDAKRAACIEGQTKDSDHANVEPYESISTPSLSMHIQEACHAYDEVGQVLQDKIEAQDNVQSDNEYDEPHDSLRNMGKSKQPRGKIALNIVQNRHALDEGKC